MSQKVIIAYNLKKIETPLKITRKIYGYNEFSNNSQYKYKRKGILSETKYEKLAKACIMLEKNDAAKIIKEFKKLKLKLTILDIELKKKIEF